MMLNQMQMSERETILPLDMLEAGQAGIIILINIQREEYLRKLNLLGVAPQLLVRMFANHRSTFIIKIGGRTIATDREIAAGILVAQV